MSAVAHLAVRGNAAIGKRKIGIGIDRPLEPHGRLGKQALVGKQLAEQRQRLGVGRLEGQCRPAARLRLRAARLKAKCGRQAETGQGGARIDGDGAGETGGRFFDAARLEKRVSEVAMTVGARRIELDGPAVHRHGFTQPARIAPCIAKVIQGIGGRRKHLLIVGPQLERALEALERFRPLSEIMQREPEIAVRLGVLRAEAPPCGGGPAADPCPVS